MELFIRTLRALWVFALILISYLSQYGLSHLLRRWELDPATGRDRMVLPGWLLRRRERLDRQNAKRLMHAILRLRGVYVKLGQVLSIMRGILPRVYAEELEALQDQVPPRPFAEFHDIFERDFGAPAASLFARIDEKPIAAASLGQVHEAWLKDGRRVAVKVLYPGIRAMIQVDMKVLWLAVIVYRFFVPVQGMERVHEALVDLLRRETDYLHEAEMMREMGANFAGRKDVLFPEPIEALTSGDVLTMTFMEGLKISRVEDMPEAGIEPYSVAVRLVESFYEQLFVHRLFHADPHPGNFLVQAGRKATRPKLVVLDFGAICEVRQEMVDGMIEVLHGIMEEDGDRLIRGFYQIGFAARGGNRELLEKTIMTYFNKLLRIKDRTVGAIMKASPEQLEQLADPEVAHEELRELASSFVYPEGWFYVERASVLLFWLVGQIDPDVDTIRVGYPYVMPLLMQKKAQESALSVTLEAS